MRCCPAHDSAQGQVSPRPRSGALGSRGPHLRSSLSARISPAEAAPRAMVSPILPTLSRNVLRSIFLEFLEAPLQEGRADWALWIMTTTYGVSKDARST